MRPAAPTAFGVHRSPLKAKIAGRVKGRSSHENYGAIDSPQTENAPPNAERRRHFAPSVGSFVPFTIIGRCSTDKTDRLIFALPKTAGNPNGKRYINKVIFNNESLGYAKRRSF